MRADIARVWWLGLTLSVTLTTVASTAGTAYRQGQSTAPAAPSQPHEFYEQTATADGPWSAEEIVNYPKVQPPRN